MNDLQCPYCDEEIEITNEGYEQDEQVEMDCPYCERSYIMTVQYDVSYTPYKADCLNGEPHDWKEIHGSPREYFINKRRCSICSREKEVKNNE